jgi:hypothetical protein
MKNRPETGLFDGVKPIYMIGLVLIGLFFVSFGLLDVLGGKRTTSILGDMSYLPHLQFLSGF